jgi:hypothetical protein
MTGGHPTPLASALGRLVGRLAGGLAALAVHALIAVAVILPAGSVGGVPIKVAVFTLAAFAIAADIVLRPARPIAGVGVIAAALLLAGAVTLAVIVTLVRGSTPLAVALQALQGVATTVGVAFVVIVATRRGTVGWRSVMAVFLGAAFVYASLKVLLAAAVYLGLVPFASVRAFFLEVFDYSFVSMLIVPGLVRIQFINDVVLPFALASVAILRGPALRPFPPVLAVVFVAVVLAAIGLAFSRWLFFMTFVFVVLWLLLFVLRRMTLLAATAATALLVGIVAVAFVDFAPLADAVMARFSSDAVGASDAARTVQIEALWTEIARVPLLGKGIGAFAPDVIQRISEPYSYEVQWLAILLQFGIVGLIAIVLPLVGLLWVALRVSDRRVGLFLGSMTVLWLMSGFTNPYLISSTSGVVFGVLAVLPLAWRHARAPGPVTSP